MEPAVESQRPRPFDPSEVADLDIMRGVSPESVQSLLEGCDVRSLRPGEALIRTGEEQVQLYILLEGRLSIHLPGNDDEPVAFIERGETVGELSALDGCPAGATVIAPEPCRVLIVEEPTFWSLVKASHAFAVNLMLKLVARLRANNSKVSHNAQLRQQYEHAALFDALTGIHNRRWLDRNLPRLVARHDSNQRPLTLAMVDVDHFKQFNDTFGHQAGDTVLAGVAQVLRDRIRPTDLVARFGGEEFSIIFPDTDLPGARCAAARLLQSVEQASYEAADGTALPKVTISIGLSLLRPGGDAAQLLADADAALYRAKHAGRNRAEG